MNSTGLPRIFRALKSWMLSPMGTLVSTVPWRSSSGVLILSALKSEPCLVKRSGFCQAWQNPDLFTKQGSLFNADKINTPLLLLHGTVDTNVPIGESIQLFNALKILGKPVEFIQVEGENHFVSDYDKRVLWHNTIMAWFARYLQGTDKWWNDLYPERHL